LQSERPARPPIAIGARMADDPIGVRLSHVLDGGAAQAAGLAANDVIVALDELKVNMKNFEQRMNAHVPGNQVALHFFRRDELQRAQLQVVAAAADTCALSIATSDRGAARRRANWLGTHWS
jgi:predicted metalloprotease with PDZ domain